MIYVSICIPTKDRVDNLRSTIESILSDNVNPSHYQIVISDNSDGNETQEYINTLDNIKYNIKYYKNPVKGFYNSIKSILIGDGLLLKLHNDYSKFNPGSFKELVELVIDNQQTKPLLFFTNGSVKNIATYKKYKKFNSFMIKASYLTTWSSAFSIWKSDLNEIDTSTESVDIMFPHTTLLLKSKNNEFLIYNKVIFQNTTVEKKGGYNIFYNFCILYLKMLRGTKELTTLTYQKIKWDLYFKFITVWYYRTIINNKKNYTFDNSNADKNISIAYGNIGLFTLKIIVRIKKLLMKYQ